MSQPNIGSEGSALSLVSIAIGRSPKALASLFIAACKREYERMRRTENADALASLERAHIGIFILLMRQQDELEAVLSKLDPSEQKPFCEALSELLLDVAFTDAIRNFRDELLRERREVASALEVLRSFCGRLHRDGLVEGDIGRFIELLKRLDEMSEFITIHDLDMVSQALPNSRKANGDFFWRVHFAQLFVGSMFHIFGRPRYALVADTINALIDAPDPVTEGSVRDACRRHRRGGRFTVAHSD